MGYMRDADGVRLDTLRLSDAALAEAFEPQIRTSSGAPQSRTYQAPSGRAIIGVDTVNGRRFAHSSFGLSRNTNDADPSAWTADNLPTGVTGGAAIGHAKMLLFKGSYYLLAKASGVPGVYRCPAALPLTWEASPVFTLSTSGVDIIQPGFNTDGDWLYLSEYGDPVGGPSVYRSSDGNTWTRVLGPGTFAGRHCHGVFPDPYNAGHVYLTCGDAGSAGFTYRSTDYGATWSKLTGALGSDQSWQSVQMSFTPTHLWLGPDTTGNFSAITADRATLTPRWASNRSHRHLPVPSGLAPRRVSDLATTASSTTVTSATAAFTADDVGSRIRTLGQNLVPIDTYIASVTNATTAVISAQATAASTNTKAIFGGEAWGAMSYYGAVDPATDIFYFVSINGGAGGNVDGLFARFPNGDVALLDVLTTSPDDQMFIDSARGRLWVRGFTRPLLSLV